MNGNEQLTSSEVAADDSEQNIVAAAATAPAGGDRAWDVLNHIHREMCSYNLIPGMMIPHLRDREVLERVPEKRTLLANAQILARDASDMRDRLRQIGEKHADRTGSSTDMDDQFRAIQIHEEYVNWSQTYDAVVLPNVAGMMEVLLDAGATLDKDRLTARASTSVAAVDVVEPAVDAGSFQEAEPAHV